MTELTEEARAHFDEHGQVVPEKLKAQVYFPGRFLDKHVKSGVTLAKIVQVYIENIGIPAAEDLLAIQRTSPSLVEQWNVPNHSIPPAPTNFDNLPLVPPAVSTCTSHFIFQGRPQASLWDILRQLNDPQHAVAPDAGDEISVPGYVGPVEEENFAGFDDAWLDEAANNGLLEALEDAADLRLKVKTLEAEVRFLKSVLSATSEIGGIDLNNGKPPKPPPNFTLSRLRSSFPPLPPLPAYPPTLTPPLSSSGIRNTSAQYNFGEARQRQRSLTPRPRSCSISLGGTLRTPSENFGSNASDAVDPRGRSASRSSKAICSPSGTSTEFTFPSSFGSELSWSSADSAKRLEDLAREIWHTILQTSPASFSRNRVHIPGVLASAYCSSVPNLHSCTPSDLCVLAGRMPPWGWATELEKWLEVDQDHLHMLLILTFFDLYAA